MSDRSQKYKLYIIIGLCFIIALSFAFVPDLQKHWASFLPDFAATVLGVLIGSSIALLQYQGRQKWTHNKFLLDIYIELKKNSDQLHSHGHILNTHIWDSGVSSGSILNFDSKELNELSDVYHQIEKNIYEAKICRQSAEHYRRLPEGPPKDQAKISHDGLAQLLHTREPDLKKQIDDFLRKNFVISVARVRGD